MISPPIPLLNYLSKNHPTQAVEWQSWYIQPLKGGMNNLLYRVKQAEKDWVIKFTQRDERGRAKREYNALTLLQTLGLSLAPQPLFLEMNRYPLLVMGQSWLDGLVSDRPPQTQTEWLPLLNHLHQTHQIIPNLSTKHIPRAVLTFTTAQDGLDFINKNYQHLPPSHQLPEIRALVKQINQLNFPSWPSVALVFGHVDPNTLNFVRQAKRWLAVDWENSGWSDPAFEVADLMSHPAYTSVPQETWLWLTQNYISRQNDPTLSLRIDVYYRQLLIWWVIRSQQAIYNHKHQLDKRLAQRPPDWPERIKHQYQHYLHLAQTYTDMTADH